MSKRLIPLFPLQLVVFPRTRLPLHIFEERYKEMVGEAIRDESEFGIVLAKDGGILNAGCTVKVAKVLEMYADGRMDILTLGQRRFEILSLNEDKDYLQGDVEFFDDEDAEPVPAEVREQALVNYEALNRMVSVRNHGDPDLEDRQISFQLAQAVPDRLIYPVEANELFLRASDPEAERLRAQGVDFYEWGSGQIRLVTSWDSEPEAVGRLAAALAAL